MNIDSWSDLGGWHCAQTLKRFFRCLDERRYDDLVALLLPEATWFRQGKLLCGHAEVLEALTARSSTMRISHIITNILVDPAGTDAAIGVAYMTAYRHDDGKPHEGPVKIAAPFRISTVVTRYALRDEKWLIADQRSDSVFEF